MQCTATADYITQNDQIKKKKNQLSQHQKLKPGMFVYLHAQ